MLDDRHIAAMMALRAANPLKDERAAESQQQVIDYALTDQLKVASKLLCAKADCLPVTGYGAGDPALPAPDGRTGIAWGVQAAGQQFVMYLFEDAALLCEHLLADGRKITNELLAQTGQQILSGSLDLESWSHSMTREIARVPRADINNAIKTTKTLPVQEAAQKLVAKLDANEVLKEIHALKREPSGNWLWQVVTDRRTAHLHVTGNGARLVDLKGQPLAELTSVELNADRKAYVRKPSLGVRIEEDVLVLFLRGFTREAAHYGLLLSVLAPFIFRHEFKIDNAIISAAILGLIVYRLYSLYPAYKEMVNIKHTSHDARWLLKEISLSRLSIFFMLGILIGGGFTLAIIVTSDWFKSSLGGVPYVSILSFPVYVTGMIFIPLLIAAIWSINVATRRRAIRRVRLREQSGFY